MINENYIIVDKKMSLKLLELGYFNSLIKVENDTYYFNKLPEIQALIDEYDVEAAIVNSALEDIIDTTKTEIAVVEPVEEIVVEKFIKSKRIYQKLIERGFELLKIQKNSKGFYTYVFEDSNEINVAFQEILKELPPRDENNVRLTHELNSADIELLNKILRVQKDMLTSLGFGNMVTNSSIINIMNKLKAIK